MSIDWTCVTEYRAMTMKLVSLVVAAIEYLREQRVVHRDIKPGNAMKFVSPDGLPIFKLIDLGGAKHLGDEESFKTLVGTEGYIVRNSPFPPPLSPNIVDPFSYSFEYLFIIFRPFTPQELVYLESFLLLFNHLRHVPICERKFFRNFEK